jgi:hypothetical protein
VKKYTTVQAIFKIKKGLRKRRGGENQFVVGFIPYKKMDSTMGTFNGEVKMRTNQHVDGV